MLGEISKVPAAYMRFVRVISVPDFTRLRAKRANNPGEMRQWTVAEQHIVQTE
jgi:hypothetical protein